MAGLPAPPASVAQQRHQVLGEQTRIALGCGPHGLEWSGHFYFALLSLGFFALTNPGPSHFKAAIRVLIYVRDTADRDTVDRALVMQPNPNRNLESYVDSNWATKFSCSGGMFSFYGCLFHWFSKMQRSVTLSSAEAEFFGAMLAAKVR